MSLNSLAGISQLLLFLHGSMDLRAAALTDVRQGDLGPMSDAALAQPAARRQYFGACGRRASAGGSRSTRTPTDCLT
jgi:hypothetical protein